MFAIDLPGHGASRVPFDLFRSKDAVAHALDRLGPGTAVIGHSLGGALLLELANQRTMGSMVLFSPAPTPLVEIQSPRVLLFEGKLDVPRIRTFAPLIQGAAKTVEFNDLAWIGHSGAPAQRRVIAQVAAWLGGDAVGLQTSRRFRIVVADVCVRNRAGRCAARAGEGAAPAGTPRWNRTTILFIYRRGRSGGGRPCIRARCAMVAFLCDGLSDRFPVRYRLRSLFGARVRTRPSRGTVLIAVLANLFSGDSRRAGRVAVHAFHAFGRTVLAFCGDCSVESSPISCRW